jgi:acetolactate synthase-1/2/3 large subunit
MPTRGPGPLRVLRAARRPVILAGIAALRCGAGPELVRLAELAGLPVVVSPMAKGTLPEDHPYFAGVLDMAGHRVVWDLLAGADLILAAGFDPVELISPWSVSTPVMHLDTTPNTDQVYASAHELVGHVGAILAWISAHWSGEPRWAQAQVAEHRTRLRAAWQAGRVPGKLNPSDVVTIAREAAPPDAIVTTDVGSHKIMAGQAWLAREPRSVLMTNRLSAMGFGVPAAIAARLCLDRPVIALVGDGGFAMVATEMRIASALGLPITVVVFADGSLNRIELRQLPAHRDPDDRYRPGRAGAGHGLRWCPGRYRGGPGAGAGRDRCPHVPPAGHRGPHRPGSVRGAVLTHPVPLCLRIG